MTGAMTRVGALIVAGAAALALPAQATAPSIDSLSKLEKGRWQVRELDGATETALLCVGDPAALLRFEHRGASGCSSEVVENAATSAIVQYSCQGRGFGHSELKVETPRSVRIQTQGISNGRPFSYRLQAQRVGAC